MNRKQKRAIEKMGKKVLVLGSGSREQAIAWKLSQSSQVASVLVAPGNAGSEFLGQKVSNLGKFSYFSLILLILSLKCSRSQPVTS